MVGERLGIAEQFQGVDQVTVGEDGSLEILERIEGGRHQVSVCAAPPAVLGWPPATCPSRATIRRSAWQHARHHARVATRQAHVHPQHRPLLRLREPAQAAAETRIVKDMAAQEIAREIVAWMAEE